MDWFAGLGWVTTGGDTGVCGARGEDGEGAGCWVTEEAEAGLSSPLAEGATGFGMTGVGIGGVAG